MLNPLRLRTPSRTRRTPRLGLDWLESRDLPSGAFDVTGLTALRGTPGFADIDGDLPGTGPNVGIAILDTGVFGNHPDLRGNFVASYDAVANATTSGQVITDPSQVGPDADPIGHGSHVAGTAASTNPDIGVAPGADLINVRVLPAQGEQPRHNTLLTGLEWVIQNQQRFNIRVVNMSLGVPGTNFNDLGSVRVDAVAQAIDRLEALGVTVVTASGNGYGDAVAPGASYPAIFSTVSVANTWEDSGAGDSFPDGRGGQRFGTVDFDAQPDRLSASSQRSSLPNQVAAPGSTILSTFNGAVDPRTGQPKLYETYLGTSMASPFVAGLVALMQDAAFTASGRYLTPDAVLQILRGTADSITDSPTDRNGRLDLETRQVGDLPETGLTFLRVNANRAVQQSRGDVGGGTPGQDTNNTRESAVAVPPLDGNRVYTFDGTVGTDGQTSVGPDDADVFRIVVRSPGSLAAITAPRGGAEFDSILRVFNASGTQIAFNDDLDETTLYSGLVVPVTPGTYYIGVSSFSNDGYSIISGGGAAGGGSQGDYVLAFRLGNDDPNGVFTGAVDFPAADNIVQVFDETFTLFDDPESGVSGKVGNLATGLIGSDPPPIDDPTGERIIVGPGDVDMFRYVVPDDGRLFVRVASEGRLFNPFGGPLGTDPFFPFDTYLRVFDENGVELGFDDDTGFSTDSELVLDGLSRGQVIYLAVSNFANSSYSSTDPNDRPSDGTGGYYELFTVFDNGDLNGTAFTAVTLPAIGTEAGGTIGTDFNGPTIGADGSLDVDFVSIVAPADGILRVTANGNSGFRPSVTIWGFQFDSSGQVTDLDRIATSERARSVVLARVTAGQQYFVSITGLGNGGFNYFETASGSGGETGTYSLVTELLPPDADDDVRDKGVNDGAPPRIITLGAGLEGDIGIDTAADGAEYVVEAQGTGGLQYGVGDIDTYRFDSPITGRVQIRAGASVFLGGATDPVLRVFDTAGNELAYNDDATNSTRDAVIFLDVVAGRTYYIGVTGFSQSAGNYDILSGSGPAAQATAAVGPYSLRIVDVTPPANTPPQISDVASLTVANGASTGPLGFTVGDAQTPADLLTITATSSDPVLVPAGAVVVGGAGAFRTVTVTPTPGLSGAATITITVQDAAGAIVTDTFVVTVLPPGPGPANTPPQISDVASLTVANGASTGPLGFTVGDAQTPADLLTITATSSDPVLVPAGAVVVGGAGAFRTVTVTPTPGLSGQVTITLTVTDAQGAAVTDTFVLTVNAPTVPPTVGRPLAVSGTADGSARVFTSGLQPVGGAITPFPGFGGDVRVATGDFNGDGVRDTVMVTGPGTKTVMAVVSGRDGSTLVPATDPFGDANFTFGGFVTAGDIDGDGRAEWVVTPELRGGPRVIIFRLLPDGTFDLTSPGQPSLVANFFGIGDPAFRDGDRAALGDVNGDGVLDVFSIAAFNGGPRTAVYNGADVLAHRAAGRDPFKLFGDFFAAPSGADEGRGGRSIAVGDVTGDGLADLIATGDNLLGTGNQVVIFSGADLLAGRFPGFGATPIANFAVGGQSPGALVSVAAFDADGDGRADLAVGSGAGQPSRVKVYRGTDLSGAAEPASAEFDPFGTITPNGVFVG